MKGAHWWLLFPALGLLELGAHPLFADRAPSAERWQALRPEVARRHRPGDLVVIAPHWAEPLGRAAFGEALMPLEAVARADASTFRRAVEVSILGHSSPELDGWRLVEQTEHAGFRLRELENPAPASPSFVFVDAIEPGRATVFTATAEGLEPCRFSPRARPLTGGLGGPPAFPRRRFGCGGAAVDFVGVTVIDDENYRPRRCIWAHPPAEGERLIRFEDVPLARVIRGYAGLPWLIMRDGMGTPVTLEVRVDGAPVGRVEHRDEAGWERFELDLGRFAGGRRRVEFAVRSERPEHRHFCFYADTR